MKIETMDKRVGPRMQAFLERIAVGLGTGEVYERVDDYGYDLAIGDPRADAGRDDDGVDVTYELSDSWAYGGEDEPRGVAPGIMITRYGGAILGQIQPYNYTAECWVLLSERDALAQVKERMDDIEDAFDDIVRTVRTADNGDF